MRCSSLHLASHSPGSSLVSGSLARYHLSQASTDVSKLPTTPYNTPWSSHWWSNGSHSFMLQGCQANHDHVTNSLKDVNRIKQIHCSVAEHKLASKLAYITRTQDSRGINVLCRRYALLLGSHKHKAARTASNIQKQKHGGNIRETIMVMYTAIRPGMCACSSVRAACLEVGQMIQFSDTVPGKVRDPGRPWVGWLLGAVQHLAPLQEELPLLCVHLGSRLQDAYTHLQRQQQLVPLKQTPAPQTQVSAAWAVDSQDII